MRFLLAIAALCCFLGNTYAEEAAAAKAENTTCCCGKAADATKTVEIKAGDKTHVFATCGDECVKAVQAMAPEDAVKAFSSAQKSEPVK
jgi:hypothetical protein